VTGDAVLVSSTGQLGIVVSSARYKHDIHDMGNASDALMKLRPVTFRYKNDQTDTQQYGLVAEEVARVYPELVSYADGKVVTVHYHELVPMLLNEAQKQAEQIKTQAEQIKTQAEKIETQAEQIKRLNATVSEERASFEQRLSTLERTLATRDQNQTLAAAGR
jgi:hypothetical protein